MMPDRRTETIDALIRATTIRVVGAIDRGRGTHARLEVVSTRDETLTYHLGEMSLMKLGALALTSMTKLYLNLIPT